MVRFHKGRLLSKTPFEWICHFVELIDKQVSNLEEVKEPLLERTIQYSYAILGLQASRKTALIALEMIMLMEWGWVNVWNKFKQVANCEDFENYTQVSV